MLKTVAGDRNVTDKLCMNYNILHVAHFNKTTMFALPTIHLPWTKFILLGSSHFEAIFKSIAKEHRVVTSMDQLMVKKRRKISKVSSDLVVLHDGFKNPVWRMVGLQNGFFLRFSNEVWLYLLNMDNEES